MDQYSYTNGTFKPTVIDLAGDETISDWEAFLRTIGWSKIAQFPRHENRDFSHISAYIYKRPEPMSYLVELMLEDTCVMYVICHNALDLMMLHRDFLTPLCRTDDADILIDAVIEASHCLFDEKGGLACAQRVKERDRQREEYYKRLREQKKAAG